MKARIHSPNMPDGTASSVIVAYDVQPNDSKVLIVGKQTPRKPVEIINAFQGDEAQMIWDMLTKPNIQMEENNNDQD